MDNISNQRVRKDGMEGNIINCVGVTVRWDNGSIYKVRLDCLKFIDKPKKDQDLNQDHNHININKVR